MPSALRRIRLKVGMTMTELAARTAMDLSKISRIENGHLRLKVDDVLILAKALGCEPVDLLPSLVDAEEAVDVP